MLGRLMLLFILTSFTELMLLVVITEHTNLLFTVGLIIVTGMLGAWLARREGLRAWRRIQNELSRGQLPSDALMDGLMILIAGALLVTPGVLTDIFGFSLLIPFARNGMKRYLASRFQSSIQMHSWPASRPAPGADSHGPSQPSDDDVIDVEFEKHDDQDQ